MVEYPLQKPYCLLERTPAYPMHLSSLGFYVFSLNFPAVSVARAFIIKRFLCVNDMDIDIDVDIDADIDVDI